MFKEILEMEEELPPWKPPRAPPPPLVLLRPKLRPKAPPPPLLRPKLRPKQVDLLPRHGAYHFMFRSLAALFSLKQ